MAHGSFIHSLQIQRRVVGALLLREVITRYGRRNIGFLWLFVEPMLFTLGVTALWAVIRHRGASDLPIIEFAVTGYSAVLLWRNTANRSANAIGPNAALMHHRNVKVMDIFLSRALLEIGGATVSFATLCILFQAAGWMRPPENVLMLLSGWGLLAWFGIALALFIGGLSARNEVVEKFWHPMTYLLFPISGAAFMVEWLPPAAREVVLWIPMVHGVEMLRGGYFGPGVRVHYDVSYLASFCLLLSLLGLGLTRTIPAEMDSA